MEQPFGAWRLDFINELKNKKKRKYARQDRWYASVKGYASNTQKYTQADVKEIWLNCTREEHTRQVLDNTHLKCPQK